MGCHAGRALLSRWKCNLCSVNEEELPCHDSNTKHVVLTAPDFLWYSKQPVSNIIYSLCGAYFLVKFLMLVCIQMFDFLFSWGVLGICIFNGGKWISSKIESCQIHWKDVTDKTDALSVCDCFFSPFNSFFLFLCCCIDFLKKPIDHYC